MTSIDYMKVLDIAALTLESESHINVTAKDLKRFTALVKSPEGKDIEFDVRLSEFSMELSVKKEMFDPKDLQKWLTKFEYQLEQNFFKNIVIEKSDNSREFIIKIDF